MGAVRLPSNTFTAQSGTSVVTDVVVFQRAPNRSRQRNCPPTRHGGAPPSSQPPTAPRSAQNAWYSANPDLVIGTLESGGMWGRDDIKLVTEDPLDDLIPAALDDVASRAVLPYPLPDRSQPGRPYSGQPVPGVRAARLGA